MFFIIKHTPLLMNKWIKIPYLPWDYSGPLVVARNSARSVILPILSNQIMIHFDTLWLTLVDYDTLLYTLIDFIYTSIRFIYT